MNPSNRERDLPLEQFITKFKTKPKAKDTDECYTPPEIYDAVLDWCRKEYAIPEDAPIVRPFRPGGDYEHEHYPEGCYVIDNPPFSLTARICKFYNERRIRYFLFASALTALNIAPYANVICTSNRIHYANGAHVCTAFVTNLGDTWIQTRPDLRRAIEEATGGGMVKKQKVIYDFDRHIIHSAKLCNMAEAGVELRVTKADAAHCREVGEPRNTPFGGAILLKDRFAMQAREALELAREKKRLHIGLTADERAYVMQD